MTKHCLYILTLAVLYSFTAQADSAVYKWTDSNGEIHYEEQPPSNPNTTVSIVTSKLASTNDEGAPANITPDTTTATTDQQTAPQTPATDKPDNCALAKQRLEALTIHPKVRVIDAQGNTTILDESERQAQITLTNLQISQFCTPQQ